jgi:hypothetical protein
VLGGVLRGGNSKGAAWVLDMHSAVSKIEAMPVKLLRLICVSL